MDAIRRFFASAVALITAILVVSFGTVVFLFGSAFMSLMMIAAGIASLVAFIAYGIYEHLTSDKENK